MSFANAIALTGGIATGKSSVCSLLQLYGFQIIDADKVAHQILDQQSAQIATLFGDAYIKESKVDRKKLGSLVFTDKQERQKLENLLHPLIKSEIQQHTAFCESKEVPYIVDIPLFFETKNYEIDEVAMVYCTKDQQLARLIEREGLTADEAQSRINAQMDIDAKKALASFVIDNTKNLKHLQAEVERFVDYIKEKYPNIKI
ncbi:MAG: dephospho-CoA kinase [Epsilonproteobacteria bacterium]|nr:dephospho-CoA kinase [Campylobacterota bacterium]